MKINVLFQHVCVTYVSMTLERCYDVLIYTYITSHLFECSFVTARVIICTYEALCFSRPAR